MSPKARTPLSKERILRAAMRLADRKGIDSLTMRRLGEELGVEAMSLYKHVANKDEILDGIIELVVSQIEIPASEGDWRIAMRSRAISARHVLTRHPWAIGLLGSRGSPGPPVLRYLDAVIASLRRGGFSLVAAAHAFWVLDCYVYGHVTQEMSLTQAGPTDSDGVTEVTIEQAREDDYPHIAELAAIQASTSAFDYDTEFEFGLDLILESLESLRIRG